MRRLASRIRGPDTLAAAALALQHRTTGVATVTDRSRRNTPTPATGSATSKLDPSTRRLLIIGVILVLALLTGQSLLAPLVLGWERANELVALEDRVEALNQEKRDLAEDIDYRKTEGGQRLAALETMGATDPGAHEVELEPAETAATDPAAQPLADRMKAWREPSRTSLYQRWRVMSLYLFDQRHPATPPSQDSN